jgi:23S rRNA (guanosine2251-2'-O)-methyltransferase
MAKRKRLRGPNDSRDPARDRGPRGSGRAASAGSRTVRLFGLHPVRAALANPARRLHRLWLTENAARTLAPAVDALGGRRPATETDARAELDRLVPPGAVHQGVVLEADPLPPRPLGDLIPTDPGAPALIVALDQVTDPQNVGAVLRSAAAFGAAGMVVTTRHAPPESGALAKAAAGALDVVPVARVANLAQALRDLQEAGFWTVGLDGDAAETLGDAAAPRTVLVLGAEGSGLRRLTAETCDTVARIPIARPALPGGLPAVESLNVSNAAAIALFVLGRARRDTP